MRRGKPKLTALWSALDEASFGSDRTLNLRELLPTAAEAKMRAETWLRARQVTKAEDVLIITGRGNQSVGGVGVIRHEILAMMPGLRRRGIVDSWKEHSPGSVVVTLAPVSSLFSAARRRRDNSVQKSPRGETSFSGLMKETIADLRQLAIINLDSLGVEHTDVFVREEMARIFSMIMSAIPAADRSEDKLRTSLRQALDESVDAGRGKV